MKKNNFKIFTVLTLIMLLVSNVFFSFATSVDVKKQTMENGQIPQKPENEIIGKIISIDATNVKISVATRNEDFLKGQNDKLPDKSDGEKTTPPEKPSGNIDNGNPPKQINMDEMFTLTGETKTINIATAEFDIKRDKNNNGNQTIETKKTYADYSVGDYISIEATDSTYTVAKKVRDVRGMGGRRGFGNPPQKIDK